MASGNRQPKWDIYEAVILLEGYLEMVQGNTSRTQIINRVSTALRQMALNHGIEIDDVYRNKNGISYQMCSMDSAYQGKTISIPSTHLFDKTVELYRTDKNRYFEILKEAKSIITATMNSPEISSSPLSISPEIKNNIIAILQQHYKYGCKYNSYIELGRFRNFAAKMKITTLPRNDDRLKTAIRACGVEINGKIYYNSNTMPREITDMVNNIFSSGACVIYYDSLFEKEKQWMEDNFITSPDLLKAYLQYYISGYYFAKTFMTRGEKYTEKEAITSELKRIWGAQPVMRIDAMHERLPYIPLNKTKSLISGNDFFVWSAENEYLLIDRFHITEDEKLAILAFVEEECAKNGFVSLSDVPLGEIEEENYDFTQKVIYNAIYKKLLSDKYHLNGNILSREASGLDAIKLLKLYLKDKKACTFDEAANKVTEQTGEKNRTYVFQALYDDMVRVNKNNFVANECVNFTTEQINKIDTALTGLITDKFCAIRDISTIDMSMFPSCGQDWNYYLLESFCYRYSKKYKLHVKHFNDKNAGIIAEQCFDKTYDEMLVIAIARSNEELSPETVGKYLMKTGYTAKSKYTNLSDIIRQAAKLRKER